MSNRELLHTLKNNILSCSQCHLSQQARPMCGAGSQDAKIFIVGDSPGKTDYLKSEPFVGSHGEIVANLLVKSGLKGLNSLLYRTNSVKCFTQAEGFTGNTVEDFQECADHLDQEIAIIRPKLIVIFGSNTGFRFSREFIDEQKRYKKDIQNWKEQKALGVILEFPQRVKLEPKKIFKITEKHGTFEWSDHYQCWLLFCYNPTYVLKNTAKMKTFEDCIFQIKKFVDNDFNPMKDTITRKYTYVYQKYDADFNWVNKKEYYKQIDYWINFLDNRAKFSNDLETTGFDPHTCEMIYTAFSWSLGEAVCIRLQDDVIPKFKPLMENKSIKIMHNGKFDCKFYRKHNIFVKNFSRDNQIAAHLRDEGDLVNLESLVVRDLNLPSYKSNFWDLKISMDSPVEEHIKIISEYACQDADATFRLDEHFEPILKSEGVWDVYQKVSMPLTNVLSKMEYDGLHYNRDYLKLVDEKLKKDAAEKAIEVEEVVYKYAYPDPIASFLEMERKFYELYNEVSYRINNPEVGKMLTASSVNLTPQIEQDFANHKKLFTQIKSDLENIHNSDDKIKFMREKVVYLMNNIQDIQQKEGANGKITNTKVGLLSNLKKLKTKVAKNLDLLKQFDQIVENVQMYLDWLSKLHKYEVNPNSSDQMAEILFNLLKLPVISRSKQTGKPSTDKKVIEELSKKHPFPSKIVEYREISHDISNYTEGYPKFTNPVTGRLHPAFSQTSTDTGRLNCKEPALHGLKRDVTIRNAITAKPGYLLVEGDLSQAEVRFLAILSNDENLLDVFRQGGDVHTQTACKIYKCDKSIITKEMRARTKRIVFGIIYGMEVRTLAHDLGITVIEAQDMMDKFFGAFPQAKLYLDSIKENIIQHGFVRNYYGRKRRMPIHSGMNQNEVKRILRQAGNAPIQGSATGDYSGLCHIKIQAYLDEFHPENDCRQIHNHHDAIILEVPIEKAFIVMRAIKPIVENADESLPIPMEFDVGVARAYGGASLDESDIEQYLIDDREGTLPTVGYCCHVDTKEGKTCGKMYLPFSSRQDKCTDHFK